MKRETGQFRNVTVDYVRLLGKGEKYELEAALYPGYYCCGRFDDQDSRKMYEYKEKRKMLNRKKVKQLKVMQTRSGMFYFGR